MPSQIPHICIQLLSALCVFLFTLLRVLLNDPLVFLWKLFIIKCQALFVLKIADLTRAGYFFVVFSVRSELGRKSDKFSASVGSGAQRSGVPKIFSPVLSEKSNVMLAWLLYFEFSHTVGVDPSLLGAFLHYNNAFIYFVLTNYSARLHFLPYRYHLWSFHLQCRYPDLCFHHDL